MEDRRAKNVIRCKRRACITGGVTARDEVAARSALLGRTAADAKVIILLTRGAVRLSGWPDERRGKTGFVQDGPVRQV